MKNLLTLGFACAVLTTALNSSAQTYSVKVIQQPAGTSGYSAVKMNNQGRALINTTIKSGRFDVRGPAYVWNNGALASLPPLAGLPRVFGSGISDTGLVVGAAENDAPGDAVERVCVWWVNNGSGYTVSAWKNLLPQGSPYVFKTVEAVSADGQFVLFYANNTATGLDQALIGQVIFSGSIPAGFGALWEVGSLDGSIAADGYMSDGFDISYDGTAIVRVVGFAYTQANGNYKAFLWEKDIFSGAVAMVDLDPSPTVSGPLTSSGEGVNASGQVAGNRYLSTIWQAHFWDDSNTGQSVGTLGGTRAVAFSINDAGSVVGWAQTGGRNSVAHAFLWNSTVGMRDLNALKVGSTLELSSASDINNAGQILARGSNKSLGSVAVLLLPQ